MFISRLNNTRPIVIHCMALGNQPIQETTLFWRLERKILSAPQKQFTPPKDLTIFTVRTRDKRNLSHETARALGYGDIFKDYIVDVSWSHRCKLQYTFLAARELKTEWILLTDAPDIIICGDLQRAIDHAKKLNCDVLAQAEGLHWPFETPTFKFERSVSGQVFCYLNSGIILMRREFVLSIGQELVDLAFEHVDDQYVWKKLYAKYYPKIRIDDTLEVFGTVRHRPDVYPFSLEGDEVKLTHSHDGKVF